MRKLLKVGSSPTEKLEAHQPKNIQGRDCVTTKKHLEQQQQLLKLKKLKCGVGEQEQEGVEVKICEQGPKIEKKNSRRWRSSRAGERITRAAAQGGVETFGAAVPGALLVPLYPGVPSCTWYTACPSEPRCAKLYLVHCFSI